MNSDQRFAMCSIATIVIFALAGGIATVSAMLGVPVGAIVLGEMSTVCVCGRVHVADLGCNSGR